MCFLCFSLGPFSSVSLFYFTISFQMPDYFLMRKRKVINLDGRVWEDSGRSLGKKICNQNALYENYFEQNKAKKNNKQKNAKTGRKATLKINYPAGQ